MEQQVTVSTMWVFYKKLVTTLVLAPHDDWGLLDTRHILCLNLTHN